MIDRLRKNPKLIEFGALGIMAIVFLFAFYYILKNNNPFMFILSFLILSIILLLFRFFVKDKFAKKFLLKCLIFPAIFILIMIIVLAYFNISDGKGENANSQSLEFDLYIINNSTTLEKFNHDLIKANKIWNKYDINLEMNKFYFIDSLNETQTLFLLDVNATDEEECAKYRDIISFSNKSDMRVLVLDSDSKHKGRGCICGCDSVILEPKKELFRDLTGWNLAHEFGHIFGLVDLRNRYNLMCDEFKLIQPKFINQEQMDSVINKFKK